MTSTAERQALLESFVSAFTRGVREEMEAMRERFGAREVPLSGGRELERDRRGRSAYAFELSAAADDVRVGATCSLRTGGTSQLVVVRHLEPGRLTLEAETPIDLGSRDVALVVAPWFLYQGLIAALERLDFERHSVARAFALFGKAPHQRAPAPLVLSHDELNHSQRAAVELCSDSDLAFVWGPPGTGKSTTLARIVAELVAQGKRVLVASSTNAALDQALARIVAAEPLASADDGTIVRLGRSEAPTFGTLLAEVTRRRHRALEEEIEALRLRAADAARRADAAQKLLDELGAPSAQQSLFPEARRELLPGDLAELVPATVAAAIHRLSDVERRALVARRAHRFERLEALLARRTRQAAQQIRDSQPETLASARLVLATLSHLTLSSLVGESRFDVVIVEEASMAILPTLFFAACLGEEKTIIVGDPRQLPPIVQSDSVFARRALGRNIFDVAVGPSGDAAPVALLDTQYRMHPSIGRLVGELFYDGRITNGASTSERESIAAAAPYPGHAVVVLDTSSRTRCRRDERSGSRINETSADLCVELACQAADRGARTVAIITPYAAQSRAVRERFGRRRGARGIECSTIHRFQGQERDVVIIDLVDTEPMRPGKLLADGPGSAAPQLLNVSVSRAAGKLILVADVEYFETRAPQSTVTAVLRQAGQQGTRVTADFGASVSTP
jgi:hypothetical protein